MSSTGGPMKFLIGAQRSMKKFKSLKGILENTGRFKDIISTFFTDVDLSVELFCVCRGNVFKGTHHVIGRPPALKYRVIF